MSDRPRLWHWDEPIAVLDQTLAAGGVLVVPTESSYALGVDPRDARGVERVYRLKRRDRGLPLPVVAADRAQVEELGARLEDVWLERLSSAWPAALSLLLPFEGSLPAAADEPRVAVRVPRHRRLRRLLAELGRPLTATSANPSGRPPIVDSRQAAEWLEGESDLVVVDGGRLPGGEPSTLVGVREGRLEVLRRGAVPVETLTSLIGGEESDGFSAASVEIFADESR